MFTVLSNLIMLIPISVVLYVAVRLNQVDGVRRDNFVQQLLHTICWVLMVAGIIGFSLWSSWLNLILIVAIAACLMQLWLSQRRAKRDILLYLLIEFGRRKRDLAQVIEVWLPGFTLFRRLSLRAAKNEIQDGVEWPVALAKSRLCKGYPSQLALRMESCYGPCRLTDHVLIGESASQGLASVYQGRIVGGVIILFISLVAGIRVFDVLGGALPKMVEEFGMEYKPLLGDAMAVLSSSLLSFILIPILVAVFLFLALIFFVPRILNWAPFRWLFPGRHKTIALRAMADMVRHRPITGEAFIEFGNLYPISGWNLRFRKVGRMMKEGRPIEKALVLARVLTVREQRALSSSLHADRFAWFLDTLVATRSSQELRRWLMLSQFLVVFEVVVLGLISLWLGIYLFGFLVSVIDGVA